MAPKVVEYVFWSSVHAVPAGIQPPRSVSSMLVPLSIERRPNDSPEPPPKVDGNDHLDRSVHRPARQLHVRLPPQPNVLLTW